MKKFLFTLTLVGALAFGSQSAFAQAKKKPATGDTTAEKPATAGSTGAPAATTAPAAATDKTKAAADKPKHLPFHTIVDSVDAGGKSFTHKNKDGKEVKNVVTATTELKNGETPAKFDDIKVGEEVKGMRMKRSETEYEVIKTTYIGAPPEKKPAAEATKPAAEPKKK